MSAPKRVAPAITIGSLFTGIGGLDLSVEACFASLRSQATTVWQVEHDPFCNEVLARHFPLADRAVRDVRDAGARTLAPVDAICGGFPCQPVSLAGRRKAREDARWLWPEFARILGELRPRYAFLENVPGLLTADDGRAFGDVLGSLASLGYAAEWDHFRASDVRAPHRRERWFLLACRDGTWEPQPHRRGNAQRGRAVDGGEAMAHGEGRGRDGAAAGGERAGVGVPLGCGAHALADAVRVPQQRGQSERVPRRAVSASARRRGEVGAVVDTDGEHREERDRGTVTEGAELPGPRSGDGRDGISTAQPGLGGAAHGLPRGLDAHQWPAGRGEPQHAHEPLRTAHAVKDRPARLKALGNAVVWQQAALAWRVLWTRAQMEAA